MCTAQHTGERSLEPTGGVVSPFQPIILKVRSVPTIESGIQKRARSRSTRHAQKLHFVRCAHAIVGPRDGVSPAGCPAHAFTLQRPDHIPQKRQAPLVSMSSHQSWATAQLGLQPQSSSVTSSPSSSSLSSSSSSRSPSTSTSSRARRKSTCSRVPI